MSSHAVATGMTARTAQPVAHTDTAWALFDQLHPILPNSRLSAACVHRLERTHEDGIHATLRARSHGAPGERYIKEPQARRNRNA